MSNSLKSIRIKPFNISLKGKYADSETTESAGGTETCRAALSSIGLTLLKHFEQCRLPAYWPTPDDVPTIGWGTTPNADGSPVQPGDHWSQVVCDTRLAADLQVLAGGNKIDRWGGDHPAAIRCDGGAGLQHRCRGAGGIDVAARPRAARYTAAADAFSDRGFQRGRVLPGLARRRAAEAARYRAAA